MAKYFKDLALVKERKSQRVLQFDENCTAGGGFFNYFDTANAGVVEILGIRIKVATSPTGYFERVDMFDGYCVDWFGVNGSNALISSFGMSQNTADSIWGDDEAGVPLVDVTKDTYDTAAFKYAFNQFDKSTRKVYANPSRVYKLSDTVYFPKDTGNHNINDEIKYSDILFDGNKALICNTVTNNKWMFSTKACSDWAELQSFGAVRITMQNITARGRDIGGAGGNASGNKNFVKIEGGRQHSIKDCKFYFFDHAIRTEWGQLPSVNKCSFTYCKKGITFADHTLNSHAETLSNCPSVVDCHFKNIEDYSIKSVGDSLLTCIKNVHEGSSCTAAIIIDSINQANAWTRGALILQHYVEACIFSEGSIYIENLIQGNVVIENAFGQGNGADAGYLVKTKNTAVANGEGTIVIRNLDYWNGKTSVRNINIFLQEVIGGASGCRWIFENISNKNNSNGDFTAMFHTPNANAKVPVYSSGGNNGGSVGQFNFKTPVNPD